MSPTASPIRRMGTSMGWLAGSLADDGCTQELAALVGHAANYSGDGITSMSPVVDVIL